MKRLDLAIELAKEAGLIHMRYFRKERTEFSNKNPRDIVTNADIEAEKHIVGSIQKHFPNDSILAEESGKNLKKSKYLWVVDPLDGTGNFFKGHPDFCVLIALEEDGEVIFGITYFPATKELYIAQKGLGSKKNGQRLKVSSENKIENMYASTHMTSKLADRKKNLAMYEKVLFKTRNIHVINACVARLLCDVAEGISDFYFKKGFNYWDYAAGSILIEEAGGKVTDLSGEPISMNTNAGVAASNNQSHSKILELIDGK